jgi:hypothetical protein
MFAGWSEFEHIPPGVVWIRLILTKFLVRRSIADNYAAKIPVGTGNNHDIAVWIAKPNFTVVGVGIHLWSFKNVYPILSMFLSARYV